MFNSFGEFVIDCDWFVLAVVIVNFVIEHLPDKNGVIARLVVATSLSLINANEKKNGETKKFLKKFDKQMNLSM